MKAKVITSAELSEWRKLADAATPGVWYADYMGVRVDETFIQSHKRVAIIKATTSHNSKKVNKMNEHNKAFIAAARSAVPRLIAEVERLRALAPQSHPAAAPETGSGGG